MVRCRIPIQSHAGVITRFVITLVKRIAARVQAIADTWIVDRGRNTRQQATDERIN